MEKRRAAEEEVKCTDGEIVERNLQRVGMNSERRNKLQNTRIGRGGRYSVGD